MFFFVSRLAPFLTILNHFLAIATVREMPVRSIRLHIDEDLLRLVVVMSDWRHVRCTIHK